MTTDRPSVLVTMSTFRETIRLGSRTEATLYGKLACQEPSRRWKPFMFVVLDLRLCGTTVIAIRVKQRS